MNNFQLALMEEIPAPLMSNVILPVMKYQGSHLKMHDLNRSSPQLLDVLYKELAAAGPDGIKIVVFGLSTTGGATLAQQFSATYLPRGWQVFARKVDAAIFWMPNGKISSVEFRSYFADQNRGLDANLLIYAKHLQGGYTDLPTCLCHPGRA
jgi:hypothetical protein